MPLDDLDQQDMNSASAPSNSSGGQSTDLSAYVPKERFTGLQGKFQAVQNELLDLKAKFHDLSGQYETLRVEADRTKTDATKQVTTIQEQFNALQQERDTLAQAQARAQAQIQTAQLVMKEYTDLVPFWANETLRVDGLEGDALKQYLENFRTSVSSFANQQTQQRRQGATPPSPSGASTAQVTEDQLYDLVMSSTPGSKEYNDAYAAWIAIRSKK